MISDSGWRAGPEKLDWVWSCGFAGAVQEDLSTGDLVADVRGLDRIPPEGPVLLVGNHSGGNVPPDTFVLTLAFCSYFGVERPF